MKNALAFAAVALAVAIPAAIVAASMLTRAAAALAAIG